MKNKHIDRKLKTINKLIVSDLDMTLLRSDIKISDYTKQVWNKMVTNGYLMSIATARSLKKSLDFVGDLTFNAPLVLLDGAIIATKEAKVLYKNSIEKELTKDFIDLVKIEFDIEPFIVGFDGDILNEKFLYPKKLNKYQIQLRDIHSNNDRIRAKKEIIPFEHNLKVVYTGKKEQMDKIEEFLKIRLGEFLEFKNSKDVYFDCNFLTILSKNTDKATALKKLCDILEISLNDTIVFGDNFNDIGMFKLAKTSIAMSNGVKKLKQIATNVLPYSNDEDGVAKYLDMMQ